MRVPLDGMRSWLEQTKKYWFIATVIVALAIAISALMVMRPRQGANPCDWLAGKLKLSPQAKAELAALDKQFQEKCNLHCKTLCATRVAIAEELKQSVTMSPAMEQHLARLLDAQAASERETVKHLLRIKAILTTDQKDNYVRLISERLYADCRSNSQRSP